MKKITYLVAPLMVLPLLVGCNKGAKTYKVSVSTVSEHLKFTAEDGGDIAKVKAKKGKDFKFKVATEQLDGSPNYEIVSDFILAEVNGTVLYNGAGLTVAPDNEGSKTALVTIDKSRVTGDITVGGIVGIEGHYIFDIPYLADLDIANITGQSTEYPGYVPKENNLVITFNANVSGVYDVDGAWGIANDFTGITENDRVLTISKDTVQQGLMIFARGTGAHWLDYFSWSDIRELSDAGAAPYLFSEGDIKTVKVNEQEHQVQIIGFGHDYLDEAMDDTSAKAGITFQFKTLISNESGDAITKAWGTSSTAHTDFINSDLNVYLQNDVFGMLEPELKEVIKPVYKKVGVYHDELTPKTWQADKYQTSLFLLSAAEYNETVAYDVDEEGTPYSGYKDAGLTLPYQDVNDQKSELPYFYYHNNWLRSPSTEQGGWTRQNYAYVVDGTGATEIGGLGIGRQNATYARALAPAFCI